jgi:hypothetical protein
MTSTPGRPLDYKIEEVVTSTFLINLAARNQTGRSASRKGNHSWAILLATHSIPVPLKLGLMLFFPCWPSTTFRDNLAIVVYRCCEQSGGTEDLEASFLKLELFTI